MKRMIALVTCVLALAIGCGGNGGDWNQPSAWTGTISLTPSAVNTLSGRQVQFTATLNSSTDSALTWSVVEGSSGGTISSTGTYTPPSADGTYHVRAAVTVHPDTYATATVTVSTVMPPPTILSSVWGSGPSDVWAVGDGLAYYWNGTKWHSFYVPSSYSTSNQGYLNHIEAVWGTGPDDVWQAGCSLALDLKHWDGTAWTHVPPNVLAYVFGLWGSGPRDVWGVGSTASSMIFHWDGSIWSSEYLRPTAGATYWMQAAWGSASDDVWAVGGGDDTGQGLRRASLFRWDGTRWTQFVSGLTSPLLGIWGATSSDIWAVGENGILAHWNGTAWTAQPSGTAQNLYSVWGSSSTNIWAVGDAGTILHWDGASWLPVANASSQNLRGVWGSGPNDIWAVGDRIILHLP